ncbi:unnamed protein product [Prorocentrum cordatum]|uniref:RNA cytidine acetyltransferase n=1 Tax=Prorocentrum cordatum TaxID=2364126 RepID=A0ABN9VG66_9DINO|nr:unnamed protein product [Polarella glacialis]
MPETLWAAVETVRGGGVVAVVLPPGLAMSGGGGADGGGGPSGNGPSTRHPLFSRLVAKLLGGAGSCILVDDCLRQLPREWAQARTGEAPAGEAAGDCGPLEPEGGEASESGAAAAVAGWAGALLQLALTADQARAMTAALAHLAGARPGVRRSVMLSGRRGRGKSFAAGLVAAALLSADEPALAAPITAVVVAAPAAENARQLMQALRQGLDAQGRRCAACLPVGHGAGLCVLPPDAGGTAVQVLFVPAAQAADVVAAMGIVGHSTLLVVDEAASVPVPNLRALLGAHCGAALLASTLSGCEGTGGALEQKVLAGEADGGRGPLLLTLREPVRYGSGCPVEGLLDQLLFLGAGADLPLPPLDVAACGAPDEGELYEVDVSRLEASENADFAYALVALLQTHYRTSASDISSMLKQPYMRAHVLMPSASAGCRVAVGHPPLVAMLSISESPELLPKDGSSNASRVSRSHLTAFAVEQDFPELLLRASAGLRISRLVCDPRLRGRGFGTAAVVQLLRHLERCSEGDLADGALADGGSPLRGPTGYGCDVVQWVGVSFGLTRGLLNFWARLLFVPAVLSPAPNPATGELSVVMIRAMPGAPAALRQIAQQIGPELGSRLLQGMRGARCSPPAALCAQLLRLAFEGAAPAARWQPGAADRARLERLARSQEPLHDVEHSRDLLSALAGAYFAGGLAPLKLPAAEEELLAAAGVKALSLSSAAADVGSSTPNLAALGLRRAAAEAARRVGLCLGKELLLTLRAAGSAAEPWSAWLPPVHELHCGGGVVPTAALAWQRAPADRARPRERAEPGAPEEERPRGLLAEWRYPVEGEAGDLSLWLAPAAGAAHPPEGAGWEAEVSLDVHLVGAPASPADVCVVVLLWDRPLSVLAHGRCRGHAQLPPLGELGGDPGGESALRLPLRAPASGADAAGPAGELRLAARWRWPLRAGRPERGSLELSGLEVCGAAGASPSVPQASLRAELRVLHRVGAASGRLGAGSGEALRLRVRVKQNRPVKSRQCGGAEEQNKKKSGRG